MINHSKINIEIVFLDNESHTDDNNNCSNDIECVIKWTEADHDQATHDSHDHRDSLSLHKFDSEDCCEEDGDS